jgi:ATP-binding cassette subfamily C protein
MRSQLRKLFQLLNRRDKQWLLVILLFMVISSALEVVSIGAVPLLITLVADPSRLQSVPIVGQFSTVLTGLPRSELVIWGGLVFLVVFLIRTAVMVLARYMQFHFAASRQVRLSAELFNRYLLAPYLYHLQHNSSELIRNIQVGAMRIGGQVIAQLLAGIQGGLMLIFILVLLIIADPFVTAVSLGVFGVFGALFIGLTSKRIKALGKLELDESKSALQTLRQSLEGIREIQLLGKPTFFVLDFRGRMKNVAKAGRDRQVIAFLSGPLLEALAILTLVLLAFSLLALGRGMTDTVALLGLYAVAFVRLKNSLATVLGTYTNLNYSLVSVDPVFQGFRELSIASNEKKPGQPLCLRHQIELEDVSFTYPGTSKEILNGVSLNIPKGAYVGLVGTTGAGKSTLINLLLGILQPTAGEVRVDGEDIHRNLRGWQRNIGYVPQDLFLLDDTVRRNIALGARDEAIDDEQVREALRKAQLLEFVEAQPDGLDTVVGERGIRLSGGQKQRVSIARALYREPSVLILDEATSALDHGTESEVLEVVRSLKHDLTIVSIAHRATTLADCDAQYRVEDRSVWLVSGDALKNVSEG